MKNIKVSVSLGNKDKLQEELNSLGKNAQIKVDLTETNASLKALIDGISNLSSKIKNLDFSGLKGIGKSANDAKKPLEDVENVLDKMDGHVSKVTIKTNAKGVTTEITEFKNSYAQTAKQVERDGQILSKSVTNNFDKIEDKLYNFTERLVNLNDKGANIDKLEQQFNKLNTNSAESEIREFEQALKELETSFETLSKFKINENLKINQNLFEGKLDIGQAEKLKNILNSITLENMDNGITKFNTEFSRSLTVTKEVQSQINSLESAFSKITSMIETTKSVANKTGNSELLNSAEFKNANTLANNLKSTLEQIKTTGKTINVNDLQTSLKSANEITASLNSKTKEAASGYKQVENALNGMQTKLNLMSKTNILDSSAINKLQKGIDDLRGTTDKSSDSFRNLVAQFKEASIAESQVKSLESAIQRLKAQMSKAEKLDLVDTDEYNEAVNSLLKLESVMNQVKTSGKAMDISQPINRATDSTNSLKLSMSGVSKVGEQMKASFSSIAQSLGIFINTGQLIRGVWDAFKEGLTYVNQLDRDFFDIQATMNITAEGFANVTKQVQAMGKELGLGADAVMEVVKTYANASTTMDEVLAKSKPSLMLSNITGINTGEVTKAVNGVTNAFKLLDDSQGDAEEATMRLGDVLVSVSQNMNYDFADGVTQLISGIKESGNVAKEAGMDIESYAGMLGAMIEATGRSGSELSNGIKMIIARTYSMKSLSDELGITTAELNKGATALAKYNIEVVNTDGSLKPFGDVLSELSGKWTTMSEAEQNWLAESLAGNRQRAVFITLMNTMAKSTELSTIALESNGTMLDVQAKYMESIEGKMGKLKATTQTFWSTLIDSSAVKGGISILTGLMETLTRVTEIFGSTATAILGIGTIISPVIPKIASLVAGFSSAGTVLGGFSAILSSMVSPIGVVITGLSLLALGIGSISAIYKDTNERIAETTESLNTFKEAQKNIDNNQSLLDTYTQLNKRLEGGNLTLEQRESIQQQINEVSTQLGGISSEVNSVLADGNKTLEEKRSIIQDIINLMGKENAETLNDDLKSQKYYKGKLEELKDNYEWAKSLQDALDNGDVRPENVSAYESNLEYAKKLVKEGYEEIEGYNEAVGEMGVYAGDFGRSTLEVTKDLDVYYKGLVTGTEATKEFIAETDNINASLTPIPNHISRSVDEIKALNKLFTDVDKIDYKVDISDINLDYVSDEFIDIANAVATAQTALEKFIGVYNSLGNDLSLMEDMKADLEQNGAFSDEMRAKIIASGNADLIALLDDEGATWENLIALIDEYKNKQKEAEEQAIERANEQAKNQDVLEEKYKQEKQRIEDIMELTNKASETSIQNGSFVDPNNSAKQITQVMEMANGLKSVVAEINGQKVMINYDENGFYKSMSNVKEISDGTYASMMNLNGTTVAVTMDNDGNTIAYPLEKITELADGTKRALGEIDGKKYVVDFDADNNIIGMQEVIYNAEEFAGIMEGLDGKTYRVTFDKETLEQDIAEVTKNIDGTYSLIDESSGHPIEIIMNDKGEVIGQIDGVKTSVAELDDRINTLNGKSIKTKVEGHEQTISDLNNIKANTDGTYTAIGMLNGRPVRVTFNNKGEVIGELQDLTSTTNNASTARDNLNNTPINLKVEGLSETLRNLGEFSRAAEIARGASGEIKITTITENIVRSITQTATTVSKGGAASGMLPKSIDIPNEPTFEPVEATQDVVIMANPIADTSEVEAFDMGSEVGGEAGGNGGDGLSAPIADVQPYAVQFKYDESSYSSGPGSKDVADLDLELDRYQKLNDVLDDYSNRLKFVKSRLNDNTLAYKDRQYYLREEIDLYWEQRDAVNALLIEKRKEAKEIQDYLKQYNFQFDENGNILNAMEMLEAYQEGANNRTGMDKDKHVEWVKFLQENVEKYVTLTNRDLASLEDQWASLVTSINNANLDLLKDFRKKLVDAIKEERETQKESQISLLDTRIEELKAELDSLDDDASDRLQERAKLESELAKWQNDNSIYGKKKVKELQDKLNELNKEIKKDEINAEIERIEAEKEAVEEDYDKKLSDKELYLEADRLLSEKNIEEIKRLLENAQPDFENLGNLLGSSFTEEFMSQIQNALDAMEYLKTGKRPSDMKNETDGTGSINTPKPPSSSSGGGSNSGSSNNTPIKTQPMPAGSNVPIAINSRVKIVDTSTPIYVDSTTLSSSGTWKGAGVSTSDTLYVYNMGNGRGALARTVGGTPIGWIALGKLRAFDTGGYTGDFSGGKLALLHSKERVLSAEQTQNFEKLVAMLGNLVKNPILQLGDMMKSFNNPIMEINNSIEINNNFNITNNTPFDLDRQNENLTQLMSRELRRFGKITTK